MAAPISTNRGMVSSVKLSSSENMVSATEWIIGAGMKTAMKPREERPSANAMGIPEKSSSRVMPA